MVSPKRLNNLDIKAGILPISVRPLRLSQNNERYLNAKLILFSELLSKKKFIITDKNNKEYSKIKKIAKKA